MMPSSTTTFKLGATAVGLGVIAAGLGSPVVGVVAALVAAVAWYFDHRSGTEKEAAAEERATRAERALAELQGQTKDRSFNAEERASLGKALSEGLRCEVWVIANTGQGEARRFAATLADILTEAGWQNKLLWAPNDQINPGIGIAQEKPGDITPCCANLRNALRSVGLAPWGMTYGRHDEPEGTLHLLVGPKP